MAQQVLRSSQDSSTGAESGRTYTVREVRIRTRIAKERGFTLNAVSCRLGDLTAATDSSTSLRIRRRSREERHLVTYKGYVDASTSIAMVEDKLTSSHEAFP